jgi:SRSO17 transposase
MLATTFPLQTPTLPLDSLAAWEQDFTNFHARFADLFARPEPREQALKYMRALMSPLSRRNGWQMAQALGDITPDRMERLVYKAVWDADQAQQRLLSYQIEQMGHPQAIGIFDETGFLKKGDQSVGVARQYSGTAGKVDNCQVAVLFGYRSPRGYGLLDKRLYLPKSWCQDPARRERAQVPKEVRFQTKPQLATQMLRNALKQGLPLRWVTADEVYGNNPKFRRTVSDAGLWYVLAVASNTRVFVHSPQVQSPSESTGRRGRPRTRARLVAGQPPAMTVAQVLGALPKEAWQRIGVAQGQKGVIEYNWAAVRVTESVERLPGQELWLLGRCSLSDGEMAYYLCHGAWDTTLRELAQVASSRFTIEQCIKENKGEAGMDEYEVRTWPSWHRHMTLSMMAYAWLGSVRRRAEVEKKMRRAG